MTTSLLIVILALYAFLALVLDRRRAQPRSRHARRRGDARSGGARTYPPSGPRSPAPRHAANASFGRRPRERV